MKQLYQKMKDSVKSHFSSENQKRLSHQFMYILGLIAASPYFAMKFYLQKSRIEEQKVLERKNQLARAKMKLFTIKITKTWWGVKTEYIQREIPLTEEQLDEMEKDFKQENYSELI